MSAYIDEDYYNNVFMGEPVTNPPLDKYITRASDIIDQLTNYQIPCIGFDNLTPFIQDQIKKATAYQVEFYIMNGGDSSLNAGTDYDNVKVGSFSYGNGTSNNPNNRDINRVSPSVLTTLFPTGLMYQGISTVDRGGHCWRC